MSHNFYFHPLAGWLGHVLIAVAEVQNRTSSHKCFSGFCITFAYWPKQVTWSNLERIMPHLTKGIEADGVKSEDQ